MTFCYSQPNVINIFTDASYFPKSKEYIDDNGNHLKAITEYACSGFIVTNNETNITSDYVVIRDRTSQFAEVYAMMMGLTYINRDVWMKRNIGRGAEVNSTIYNVFSDSQYTVYSLKYWMNNWVNITNYAINRYKHPTYNYDTQIPPRLMKINIPNKKVKKSNKKHGLVEVKNQEVLLHCMGLIASTQIPINIYHVKAHTDMRNRDAIESVRTSFLKINNIPEPMYNAITTHDICSMIHWNDEIDTTTRTQLYNVVKYDENMARAISWPVRFYPTREQQMIYQNFIR